MHFRKRPGRAWYSIDQTRFEERRYRQLGVIYDGYYGDSAMTVSIGEIPPEVDRLVKVTEQCLYRAIEQAIPGNFISDISAAVQKLADANNFGIVREFCGHGIGRSLHEDPPVLNYVHNEQGPQDQARSGYRDRADDQSGQRQS